MKHSKKLSNHHLVPKNRGGNNSPRNIARIKDHVHQSIHILFGPEEPTEQIETLLFLNMTVLREEFRNDITQIIQREDEYVYEKGIMKPSRYKKD